MSDLQNGPAGKLENPADIKKKQFFLLAIVVIGVLLAAFFTTLFTDTGPKPEPDRKKEAVSKTTIATPGSRVDPREVWIGTAGNQIANLEKEKQALEDRVRRLETRNQEVAAAEKNSPPPVLAMPSPPAGLPPMPSTTPTVAPSEPLRGAGQPTQPPVPLAAAPISPIVTTLVSGGGAAVPALDSGEPPFRAVASKSGLSSATTAPPAAAGNRPPAQAAEKDLTREDYMPAGSFFRAVMLSGLDAPTGGQVQANPHPVLLRLLDNAVLPNYFRAQVKECFIVAAGYGDMSSERAYLRTESLSCVNTKGQVIDVAINGWAIGDDGKAGVRGRVISKQGQALANAIMSGVLSGIGSAIRESSVNTQVTGLTGNVVQTPKPGEEFKAGLGGGISKGVDKLTDYYVKLAERMFPVIEVDAGRVVDIALSKGISLKGLFKPDGKGTLNAGDTSALARRQQAQQDAVRQPESF